MTQGHGTRVKNFSSERPLIDAILRRHGSRPDLRLWRNETGTYYTGHTEVWGRDCVIRNYSRVSAGLCKGSSDLVGLTNTGRFIGIEVKYGKTRASKIQKRWLALIAEMGGISGVATSVEDVDELLGEPPR